MIKFDYIRRFGIEAEYNAFDGRSRPEMVGDSPAGIDYIGNIVNNTVKKHVEIRKYGHTHWRDSNGFWVLKPDASCGLEVCSPVSKGWIGTREICEVIHSLGSEDKVKADHRCSFHIHVDVSDLLASSICDLIMWWVKCESVFMDLASCDRKLNKYAQFIGLWDWIKPDSKIGYDSLLSLLGTYKYTSLNTFHLYHGSRSTIEFRIAESHACKCPYTAKMWIKLILHFVECTLRTHRPESYQMGNCLTGWAWMEPIHVFDFLLFNNELSKGMEQLKDWFCARLIKNIHFSDGIFSKKSKSKFTRQISELAVKICEERGVRHSDVRDYFLSCLNPSNLEEVTFDDIYNQ